MLKNVLILLILILIQLQELSLYHVIMDREDYYLEILSELGVFGFSIFIIIFLIITLKSFVKKYFTKSNLKKNYLIIPFIFLFLAEIFPIRNTGSFFSTFNATYFFLIMSILIGLVKKQNLIEEKV